jgi:ribosome-associated translation inhibitor RaiA
VRDVVTEFMATNIPRPLRTYAENRVGHALAAFEGGFDLVKVSLAGTRHPSGPVTCQIKVRLIPSGIWITRECRDGNPYAAIEYAADGIARSFARQLARQKNLPALSTAA